MKWKKLLALGMAAVMTAAFVTGCGGQKAADSGSGSGDKGKIIVGLDDNFPPMGFKDENNEITGFDVDLAKEASKRLGREVEFKAIDWSSKEAELKSGRVNVLWNGLDITEKRKENMLFSDPYMDNRQIIFVKKGRTDITDEKSLAGKIVGTQSASTAEEYMDKTDFFKKDV
ncbi:MAG: transporter substrate-binding domain-containing protein, partial [Mitsuokella jalaludinii]|nr:transporter substrate-binding domain-containing protein [Mitsuokella jalaludinii]